MASDERCEETEELGLGLDGEQCRSPLRRRDFCRETQEGRQGKKRGRAPGEYFRQIRMYTESVPLSFLSTFTRRRRGATNAAVDGRRNGDKNESRNPIYILRQCRTLLTVLALGYADRDKYGSTYFCARFLLCGHGSERKCAWWPVEIFLNRERNLDFKFQFLWGECLRNGRKQPTNFF